MSSLEVAPFSSTHLFPQCCYNSVYIIPCTRFSVHFFHIGSYSDTVSICTTKWRRYENDTWVTVLARGNRSSPWKTRLSATLFIINVDKAAHGQVSLRISCKMYPKSWVLSTAKVNMCVFLAIMRWSWCRLLKYNSGPNTPLPLK